MRVHAPARSSAKSKSKAKPKQHEAAPAPAPKSAPTGSAADIRAEMRDIRRLQEAGRKRARKTPAVAGGSKGNARTNKSPAHTRAAQIDRKMTPEQRELARARQAVVRDESKAIVQRGAKRHDKGAPAQARKHVSDYYRKHPVHVDDDGVAYAASYDRRSGRLALERNDDRNGLQANAPSRAKSFAAGKRVTDTHIDIDEGGERVTRRTTSLASPKHGRDETIVQQQRSDRSGKVVSEIRRHTATRVHDDGSRSEDVEEERKERGTTVSDRSTRAVDGADGSRTRRRVLRDYADGEQTREQRSTSVKQGDRTLREHADVTYADGRPKRTELVRSVDTSRTTTIDAGPMKVRIPVKGTSTYDIRHDAKGQVESVTGPKDVDGREPLDAMVEHAYGPAKEGERRAAFGPVVRSGEQGEVEGRKYRKTGIVSQIGMSTVVSGKPVFIEGGMVHGDDRTERIVGNTRSIMRTAPKRLMSDTKTLDVVDARAPDDAYWSAKYGKDFTSFAANGGKHVTFYGGNEPDKNTIYHEFAHSHGDGSPSGDAWRAAMLADQKGGAPVAAARRGAQQPLVHGAELADRPGISDYAQGAYEHDRNPEEDWADSTSLYVQSRQNGGLVRVTQPDGTSRVHRFEELYPHRAKLLDGYYGIDREVPQR